MKKIRNNFDKDAESLYAKAYSIWTCWNMFINTNCLITHPNVLMYLLSLYHTSFGNHCSTKRTNILSATAYI